MIIVIFSACGNLSKKLKHPVIKKSSVEIDSAQNSEVDTLHFFVNINDYVVGPEQEYKVRFIIQDTHISDLIGTEKIDIPETYKTMPSQNRGGHVTLLGTYREIKEEYSVDEIKKI